ncbi:MAG TPA: hypothetical protein VGM64_04300 [Lacunisphaera sp.]|jgi:hypothetical protein
MIETKITPTKSSSRLQARLKKRNRTGILFLLLCALAALRPLLTVSISRNEVGSGAGFPGWFAAPLPSGVTPLALSSRDVRFAEQFPGQIAAFADGQSTWIVRWVARPTRKLHPASDCLRATGYTVMPEPIFAEANGAHWGVVSAVRGPEKLIVHERIIDASGREFTDVSAWFWSAVLEKSPGPWWCLTRIEPVPFLWRRASLPVERGMRWVQTHRHGGLSLHGFRF